MSRTIDEEIEYARDAVSKMLDAYKSWNLHIKHGKVSGGIYGEIVDYVNFRIETAESCLLLIENNKVADALGLCRSILEHFMLLRLMCRGTRYYQLEDLTSKSPTQISILLKERQDSLKKQHANGENQHLLYVDIYPNNKKTLMWVFEGLHNDDDDSIIPLYLFQLKDFDPITMRLKDEDYFTYYESAPHVKKARAKYQLESIFRHRHYLSYNALVQCLDINDLFSSDEMKRLDAHYTFLGTFLHPTFESARQLYDRGNWHDFAMKSGLGQRYSKTAELITTLYVAYLVSSIIDELANLLENAPSEYFVNPGTTLVREATLRIPRDFEYFWFIENEAPLYDRFNHAVQHVEVSRLDAIGGYENIPTAEIKFNQRIMSHFIDSLGGWSYFKVGKYTSPIK